jgi:hypothetical protein
MVLPSDGENSISLWDTQEPNGLLEWLNENLGADCTTVLHEVRWHVPCPWSRFESSRKSIRHSSAAQARCQPVLACTALLAAGEKEELAQ